MGVRKNINTRYSKLKMREWYRGKKKRAVEYKGGACESCGYSRSLAALEFHHRDPKEKDFKLSSPHVRQPWHKQKTELDKCSLLCANCHREKHEELMQQAHSRLHEEVRGLVPERPPSLGKVQKYCESCGASFESYVAQGQRFCSRDCKSRGQRGFEWPPDDELLLMSAQKTPTEIALDVGTTPKSVRQRLTAKGIPWTKYRQNKPS